MENEKQITVIGATGNIGAPVVKHLLNSGFHVKAIVRNPDKARQIFNTHENIEILQADLTDLQSLKKALTDTRYLYLNLSTKTIKLDIPFAEEREGIQNILKAADRSSIKQIITISGSGTLENYDSPDSFKFIPNIIRKQGHKLLKDSGIPYTILHCSWFLDSFVFYRRNNVYSIIGNPQIPIYFTNCYDFSRNLMNATGNENAFYREFPVQGKLGCSHLDAAKDFLSVFSEKTKVKVMPQALIAILAVFIKEMKFVKHMSDYFHNSSEAPIAEEFGTYSVLGNPVFGIKEYANWLTSKNFFNYLINSENK